MVGNDDGNTGLHQLFQIIFTYNAADEDDPIHLALPAIYFSFAFRPSVLQMTLYPWLCMSSTPGHQGKKELAISGTIRKSPVKLLARLLARELGTYPLLGGGQDRSFSSLRITLIIEGPIPGRKHQLFAIS